MSAGGPEPGRRILRRTFAALLPGSLFPRALCSAALLTAALLLGPLLAGAAQDAREPIHLVILHTNDVHGQVLARKATWLSKESPADPPSIGGLPRLAAEVARIRAAEPDALLVDGGDWYQGTPEGALERGLPFARALAQVGYDALCLGNHDFDHGVANAERLVREAGLPALAANVRSRASGERLPFAAPWLLVERAGVRIAFVGLVTPDTPEITHAELRAYDFAAPAAELARVRAELGARADFVVPVGHIGVEEARELARSDPRLALIVSGHSHTYLEHGAREGETLIVQAGAKASALGRVDLWLDPATFAPLRSEARLIDLLDEVPAQPASERARAVRDACGALAERASEALEQPVGELARPLTRDVAQGCSAPGSWIADALRERMGADVGVHNRGGTRCDLPAGKVTRRQLFELLPFDNDVVAVTLRGAELLALARRGVEGTRHLGLDFSGLRLHVRRAADGTRTLERVEVAGKPLDPAASYRVATNSFLAGGGDGAVELAHGTDRRADPAFLREVMEQRFVPGKPLELPDDAPARWVEVGP